MLNVLAGKATYGRVSGAVRVNGARAPLARFGQWTGFVPQEDTMLRALTVGETLYFYAALRLPRGTPELAIRAAVRETLGVLGLAHVRDWPIGDETTRGVSGGQRKRANIGMEVAACPVALCVRARLVSGLSLPPLHPSLASSCVPARRTGL